MRKKASQSRFSHRGFVSVSATMMAGQRHGFWEDDNDGETKYRRLWRALPEAPPSTAPGRSAGRGGPPRPRRGCILGRPDGSRGCGGQLFFRRLPGSLATPNSIPGCTVPTSWAQVEIERESTTSEAAAGVTSRPQRQTSKAARVTRTVVACESWNKHMARRYAHTDMLALGDHKAEIKGAQ